MVNPTTPPVPTTIAGLPAATTPLGNADLFVVEQGGVTKNVTAAQAILPGQLNSVVGSSSITVTQIGGVATVSLTTPVTIANGGTGSSTASTARTALGLGTVAVENLSSVIIDNGAGALTIGAAQVAATMLVGTDIATVGTITSGVWNAGAVTSSGAITGTGFIPTGSSVPANGVFLPAANVVGFATASTERARINSTGIFYNCTVAPSATVSGTMLGDSKVTSPNISSSGSVTTSTPQWQFYNGNGLVGTITTNGSATAYNTSSDYRLKDNVVDYTDGLGVVVALRPVSFTWKKDGTPDVGFIAHEAAVIVPRACSGIKDAVTIEKRDEEDNIIQAAGEIIPQGLDTSFIVAHLVSAVQSLNNQLIAMQAKLTGHGIV